VPRLRKSSTSIVDVYQTISDREAFLKQLKNEKYVTNYEVNYRRTNGDSAWAMLNATVSPMIRVKTVLLRDVR